MSYWSNLHWRQAGGGVTQTIKCCSCKRTQVKQTSIYIASDHVTRLNGLDLLWMASFTGAAKYLSLYPPANCTTLPPWSLSNSSPSSVDVCSRVTENHRTHFWSVSPRRHSWCSTCLHPCQAIGVWRDSIPERFEETPGEKWSQKQQCCWTGLGDESPRILSIKCSLM